MVLLCFVLDLRSLSPQVLRDLKQSLFQLANYCAVTGHKIDCSFDGTQSNMKKPLLDRFGMCYVLRDRTSCTDELKISYDPLGNFNLRDLHQALNNLPTDAFCPESNDLGALYLTLAHVLGEQSVYTWGGQDKNISRKVILISSYPVGTLDSMTIEALMDAADKSVLVEYILLELPSSHLGNPTENIDHFAEQIGSLKNCSFQTCFPDPQVLYGLTKRWYLELKNEREEPLQARFVFKANLMSTLNQISCNLQSSSHPIVDEFIFFQTCRCHGLPLDHSNVNQTKRSSCPVTNDHLGAIDIIENSVRVGEQTILYMPSFQDSPKLKQVSSCIDFNVIQRTNLGSLSEGLIIGGTYFVTPTFHGPDENNKTELNNQLFQVVCSILNSLDQGLVCSSNCNIETARETSFRCYYILVPSDKGLMLLRIDYHKLITEGTVERERHGIVVDEFGNICPPGTFIRHNYVNTQRLSAAEDFLPIPDIHQLISSDALEEIEKTVQASLQKMEVSDYIPVHFDRGFHRKLNLLVKESLHFGAISPKGKEGTSEPELDTQCLRVQPSKEAAGTVVTSDKLPQVDIKLDEKKSDPCLTEEWEKLIVTELGSIHSPTCISNPKLDQLVASPSQSNRQLDEKTSRILERLELPRQLKRKAVSPTISSSPAADICALGKKPLIPFSSTDYADQVLPSSQPIKPNFQRIKRRR